MNVSVHDVYVANISYGHSTDRRPCVVLEVLVNQRVTIVRLSSATQLFNPAAHFAISDQNPDFHSTGLKRSSYADGIVHELPISDLIKFVGRLEGRLARDFEDWIG